jgi:hypothetical protein
MSRLAEVERKIDDALVEIKRNDKKRDRTHRMIQRRTVIIREVRRELGEVKDELKDLRARVKVIIAKLEELREATPDEYTEQEKRLEKRLDHLAGVIDELVSLRDRLLNRLDRLAERQDDARQAIREIEDEDDEDRDRLVYLRDKRRRIKEARAKNDRPSPNFDWAEFDCNDGTPHPPESRPAIKEWCIRVGEPARKAYNTVFITSAFRHVEYNRRIGGESGSVHIYNYPGRDFKAVAVDFKCAKATATDWYNFTYGKADGRGKYNTFHHADTRNNLGWGDATWSG